MIVSRCFIILSTTCILTIVAQQLHDHLTKSQIRSIFLSEKVPFYQLVRVKSLNSSSKVKRSVDHQEKSKNGIILDIAEEKLRLYLEPNENYLFGSKTTAYLAKKKKHSSIKYEKIKFPLPQNLKTFQDSKTNSALTIHEDSHGLVHYNGIIGNNLAIRSLPHEVRKSIDTFPLEDDHHILMNLSGEKENFTDLNKLDLYDLLQSSGNKNDVNYELRNHDNEDGMAFLQVLIAIDYETYKYFNIDLPSIGVYIAAFWNAVDLRFRELSNPKIRINIAGLIIPQDAQALKYLSKYELSSDLIRAAGRYFFDAKDDFPFESYDVTASMIKRYGVGTIGKANISGVCTTQIGTANTAFVHQVAFDTVITAAHELGHALGVRHDTHCNVTGYLMQPKINSKFSTSIHWSPCSIEQMRQFLQSDQAKCVYNKPDIGTPYHRQLPGQLISRDEQCRRIHGEKYRHAPKSIENCVSLVCISDNGKRKRLHLPPADGSDCGENKICLNGECIQLL